MEYKDTCIICNNKLKPGLGNAGKIKQFCSNKCYGQWQRQKSTLKRPKNMLWCSWHKQYEPITSFPPKYQTTGRGMAYCKEGMRDYQKNKFNKKKQEAVIYLGGKCSKCNYDKCFAALDFHHIDPTLKTMNWTKLRSKSIDDIKAILTNEKCILLCANCHREEHFNK